MYNGDRHEKVMADVFTDETYSMANSLNVQPLLTSSIPCSSIPFVQIHTTDVQPQPVKFRNVFRRGTVSRREIKAEPIKSETTDISSKDRFCGTPTPLLKDGQTQNENSFKNDALLTHAQNILLSQSINGSGEGLDNYCGRKIQIFKCIKCPYLCLKQLDLDAHLEKDHTINTANNMTNNIAGPERRIQVKCVGCLNIFYTQRSLVVHLNLDHLMSEDDSNKLMENYIDDGKPLNGVSKETQQNSSKIYLKSVKYLREPDSSKEINECMNSINNEEAASGPPKQKISIKSVDVLREPELLRRSNLNLQDNKNFNTSFPTDNCHVDVDTNNSMQPYHCNQHSVTESINNINSHTMPSSDKLLAMGSFKEAATTHSTSNIHIKSVEGFNPTIDATLSIATPDTNYSDKGTLTFNVDNNVYDDTNVMHLPFLYEGVGDCATHNNQSNGTNFIHIGNSLNNCQFLNNVNCNNNDNNSNNYALEAPLINTGPFDYDLNTNTQSANLTLIAQPTAEYQATKSEQISKKEATAQFSFSHEARGTLHLRTVDELNLMNKNEVQSLIAPNLDNNNNNNNNTNHHTNNVGDDITTGLDAINILDDSLYPDESFKFHDLDTQMVYNWSDNYEELAQDINCIIAENTTVEDNNVALNAKYHQKCSTGNTTSTTSCEIDTSLGALISIRDIEELTATALGTCNTSSERAEDNNRHRKNENISPVKSNLQTVETFNNVNDMNLFINAQDDVGKGLPGCNDNNTKEKLNKTNFDAKSKQSKTSNKLKAIRKSIDDIPPLVPVGMSTFSVSANGGEDLYCKSNNCSDNVAEAEKLFPIPPLIKFNTTTISKSVSSPVVVPIEKGRIYVANNLMEHPKQVSPPMTPPAALAGRSVRGRPFGFNRTGIKKPPPTNSKSTKISLKCSVKGCAFRFKNIETMDYHKKCHNQQLNNSTTTPAAKTTIICPECKSINFNNWNTLHTHLWRQHQIDMELYKCELCTFKTPIYSRLINTHAKIHYEERNYKCEQCPKAFKNSKQLKNHRRWHRGQSIGNDQDKANDTIDKMIHCCSYCGVGFSQLKSLREHCCKAGETQLQCDICQKSLSSRSSLRLHKLTHSNMEKRYKCTACNYTTNDHNAIRRHKMSHEKQNIYHCHYCDYKSVQSASYQKHVNHKHPEQAHSVLYKCLKCHFSTVNRALLITHRAKHESASDVPKLIKNNTDKTKNCEIHSTKSFENKIKVKSNLFTALDGPISQSTK